MLAKNQNAEIKILHIFRDSNPENEFVTGKISNDFGVADKFPEIKEIERRNAVAFIKALQNYFQKFELDNVKYHFDLQNGRPEEQIIAFAGHYNPDIIILGTKGSDSFPDSIIGSFATRVIENINIPVLAIPENWSYKNFEKINVLYATDFLNSDANAFGRLIEILRPFDTHFDCVHIELNKEQAVSEMQMFNLESHLSKEHPEIAIKCHVIPGNNLLKGIQNFVDRSGTDIISFITPKRSTFYKLFYPNNLKKMVYQSKIPLFIFHPAVKEG
jgi:nucleotide-binding universal stress UspA family protein